jgi:serine protease inhibitor
MRTQTRRIPPSVVQTINQLGWNLATHLRAKNISSDGIAVSPLSITIALGMLAGGADKAKCKELCGKLGLNELDKLVPAISTIQDTLASAFGIGRQFTSANAIFADNSTEVVPTFVEYLERFGAHLDCRFSRLVDGTEFINGWISEQTNGLIPSMLSRRILSQANMVLINALVFKAVWQKKFDPKNTIKDFPFHTSNHRIRSVEMMFFHRQEVLISRTSAYTAVRLPYASSASSRWSFIAYLPSKGRSPTNTLQTICRDGTPRQFIPTKLQQFGLPKFNLHAQEDIAQTLLHLGYPISGKFPKISDNFIVQHIIHSVAILLDENGTEAAAATAVVLTRSVPAQLPSVVFDRPFVFSIVAEDMDLVLFNGVFSVE